MAAPALCDSSVNFRAIRGQHCDSRSSLSNLRALIPARRELVSHSPISSFEGELILTSFKALTVRKSHDGSVTSAVELHTESELPSGDVTIRVERSAINYKDALAATGHAGIVKSFPHVPGIDAAGTVVESSSPDFKSGDAVFTTGHELGVERWGGWSELIRVPANSVLPLPVGLTIDEAMTLGTAGFTAAQCIAALQHHGVAPDSGEVVVTGATGGVGSLAVRILSKLGFQVVAITGKTTQHDWLRSLGAARVALRDEFLNVPDRPLVSATIAGGIDTVGGTMLSTLLRMIRQRGCVACCGMAGGTELATTVYPFILRGVTLAGIDSAWCPDHLRPALWNRLASDWKPRALLSETRTIGLTEIPSHVAAMLAGRTIGRTLIDPSG